jgi:hypothetical protein
MQSEGGEAAPERADRVSLSERLSDFRNWHIA